MIQRIHILHAICFTNQLLYLTNHTENIALILQKIATI